MTLTKITIEVEARGGLPDAEYEALVQASLTVGKITASNIAAIRGINRVWVICDGGPYADDETAVYHGA